MKSPLQAEDCFNVVIGHRGQLDQDSYLIPYAMFDRALLLKAQGHHVEAMDCMEKAKNDYKDYTLQSRLHFRIHSAQTEIRAKLKARKESSTTHQEGHDDNIDRIMPLVEQPMSNFEIPMTEDEAKKIIQAR